MQGRPRPFISYAREDQSSAVRLYGDLRELGAEPWLDAIHLIGGQDWQHAIREALRGATHFLPLISSHSVNKRGFVQKEVKQALDLLAEFPPDRIFVVPVRLEAVEPAYEQLKRLHWVDLFSDRAGGLSKLAESLGLGAAGAHAPETSQEPATSTQRIVSSPGRPILATYPRLDAVRIRVSDPLEACERYRDVVENLVRAGRWSFKIGVAYPSELLVADDVLSHSLRSFARELRAAVDEIDMVAKQDVTTGFGLFGETREALLAAAVATEHLRDSPSEMRSIEDRAELHASERYRTAVSALNRVVEEIENAEAKWEMGEAFLELARKARDYRQA